jgi:hypothetical protein
VVTFRWHALLVVAEIAVSVVLYPSPRKLPIVPRAQPGEVTLPPREFNGNPTTSCEGAARLVLP